ncbi:hypothetical protein FOZ61_008195 [Perkinsus olseni]|uniref:non-specific serine/threonine protein kinase n=1 Tax=Perkinsus olseni TaxID=32597 RepID=A0A7J6L5R4_PEROL|nr:hypothetical protein FOZ61_008195 [Perkinsus olseni]
MTDGQRARPSKKERLKLPPIMSNDRAAAKSGPVDHVSAAAAVAIPSAEAMEAVQATYKKVGTLGHGSFGKVYLVLHTPTKELRVLKQMDVDERQISETKDPRKEALREAWVLKKMNHPFIISYHDVFVTPRQKMCIVMGYADGGDLHTYLKRRRGLLAEEEVLRMFTQLCLAIDHVHKQRVIHRDLKSQNVFLHGPQRTVKLGDFGISRVLEKTRDLARTMVGTPYYLSPEIIMEQPYGFKSDVWSMGVILYEMLTLKHPFDARNIQHLAVRILNLKFEDPDRTRYTKETCDMVRMLLTRESEKRPSCDDILNTPLLRNYVLRELGKCRELDYRLRSTEAETTSSSGVKLPALPSRPSGFVARIRGLTRLVAQCLILRSAQMSYDLSSTARYYEKEELKLPSIVPSPVTNPQEDQVLIGSIGDPLAVAGSQSRSRDSQSMRSDVFESQEKRRSADRVSLPPIKREKLADSLENRPNVDRAPKQAAEVMPRVGADRGAEEEDEYPEDFEEEEESGHRSDGAAECNFEQSKRRKDDDAAATMVQTSFPQKSSISRRLRSSKSPPKHRRHSRSRDKRSTPQQRVARVRAGEARERYSLSLPDKLVNSKSELVDHSECVRRILLQKMKGKRRLLDKMLELARTTDYERFDLTARGLLMGAFNDPLLHDPKEQTRIIHLSAVVVILEDVRDQTIASTVLAG